MLNLDRLRVLRAIEIYGSVQGAADALNVSSSAVSQQVAKLEKETGQQLLDRRGRGVQLTDAGTLLASRTTFLLDQVELLERDLDSFRNAVAGSIGVAAFPTALRGLGPQLIASLARHEQLTVTLRELEPADALAALARGEVDVVIAPDWFNAPLSIPEGLTRVGLFDDVVDVALPVEHRLANKKRLHLDQLLDQHWVTWPPGTICGDWLLHTYRSIGREPLVVHTAVEHATQLTFVEANLGAAVIPRLGRGAVPAGVRMVPVEPALLRHVFAVWRSNNAKRSNVEAVRAALLSIAKKHQQQFGVKR